MCDKDRRDKRNPQVLAQSTQATTSAAEAVNKAVEDRKATTADWSKLVTGHKAQICLTISHKKKRLRPFREWSWVFEKYLSPVDEAYMKDLEGIHDKPSENFDMVKRRKPGASSAMDF